MVEGLIPMDIAMVDVVNEFPKLEQKGFSKTSSSGIAYQPIPQSIPFTIEIPPVA